MIGLFLRAKGENIQLPIIQEKDEFAKQTGRSIKEDFIRHYEQNLIGLNSIEPKETTTKKVIQVMKQRKQKNEQEKKEILKKMEGMLEMTKKLAGNLEDVEKENKKIKLEVKELKLEKQIKSILKNEEKQELKKREIEELKNSENIQFKNNKYTDKKTLLPRVKKSVDQKSETKIISDCQCKEFPIGRFILIKEEKVSQPTTQKQIDLKKSPIIPKNKESEKALEQDTPINSQKYLKKADQINEDSTKTVKEKKDTTIPAIKKTVLLKADKPDTIKKEEKIKKQKKSVKLPTPVSKKLSQIQKITPLKYDLEDDIEDNYNEDKWLGMPSENDKYFI